jgi:hypothetical protein
MESPTPDIFPKETTQAAEIGASNATREAPAPQAPSADQAPLPEPEIRLRAMVNGQ